MRAETSELLSISGADVPTRLLMAAHAISGVPISTIPQRPRFDVAASPGVTRAQQIAETMTDAMADKRFCAAVAVADAARDRGDWVMAEREYAEALALYPLHWGYAIQYAHVAKEQGLLSRAEAWYRSAVGLGSPAAMVDEHLAFVAQANGARFARAGMPNLDVPPLSAPPTLHDLRQLGELTGVPGLTDDVRALAILRTAPDNRAALLHVLDLPAFARANRLFLDIVRGVDA